MSATRVLWLAKGLGRGGAEMLLVSLARAMERTDLEIEVGYRLSHKTALVESLHEASIPTHCLDSGHMPWPVALRRLLTTGHFDIVHSHAPLVGAAARITAPRGTRMLHTEHNTWQRYHPATRAVNAATFGRNTQVWAVSDEVARSVRVPGPLRQPPVSVLLHGVDLHTVKRGADARRVARERLGIPDDRFVFGTVGNLAPKKDQGTMLTAFACVRQQLPGACLVVVGTGPREGDLRELARRLGIEEATYFLGMRDDVPELLPGFDTFILSSLHEGLSIALVEALAACLPVVATRVGGIPQLIVDGQHGVLVPPRDQAALAREMLRMATDAVARHHFAAAAPIRAAEFGIQPAADALASFYRECSGEGATKAGAA